jgi:hypothetical protein
MLLQRFCGHKSAGALMVLPTSSLTTSAPIVTQPPASSAGTANSPSCATDRLAPNFNYQ